MVKVLIGVVLGVAFAVPASRHEIVKLGGQVYQVLVSVFHAILGMV
jgi:hypothetical protein